MHELEKMMNSLPNLVYKKANGDFFVAGFRLYSQDCEMYSFEAAVDYFNEMVSLYKDEKKDIEYNRRLVDLFKKVRDYVEDYPISKSESRNILNLLSVEDVVYISDQITMYKKIRSMYSKYK